MTRAPLGGSSQRLFRSDSLNSNPILLEYLAACKMEAPFEGAAPAAVPARAPGGGRGGTGVRAGRPPRSGQLPAVAVGRLRAPRAAGDGDGGEDAGSEASRSPRGARRGDKDAGGGDGEAPLPAPGSASGLYVDADDASGTLRRLLGTVEMLQVRAVRRRISTRPECGCVRAGWGCRARWRRTSGARRRARAGRPPRSWSARSSRCGLRTRTCTP